MRWRLFFQVVVTTLAVALAVWPSRTLARPSDEVFFDPNAPASVEYALPDVRARDETSGPGSERDGRADSPFGAGLKHAREGGDAEATGRPGGRTGQSDDARESRPSTRPNTDRKRLVAQASDGQSDSDTARLELQEESSMPLWLMIAAASAIVFLGLAAGALTRRRAGRPEGR